MPRHARFTLPDVPLHVIQRGNDRQAIFFVDADCRRYLDVLHGAAGRTGCAIHAFCLMTNHVHLLLTPATEEGCAALMKQVGQQHAQYVNRTYRRSGTLWEGRFRSAPVQAEDYLLACQRYIELNPVRARMAAQPGEYRWSSYGVHGDGRGGDLPLRPHPLYLALGADAAARQAAWRMLVDQALDPVLIEAIRAATNGGYALGNAAFAAQIAAALGRRVTPGKAGRPPKPHDDERQEQLL
ncbi:transposase [Ferrovibrio xuzhouensis]|uniref:Transposase n=1 Tax=Ferrovibrio xuzhouensis TaxID=1576914 RepID=A0ABV7VIG7_9PROT